MITLYCAQYSTQYSEFIYSLQNKLNLLIQFPEIICIENEKIHLTNFEIKSKLNVETNDWLFSILESSKTGNVGIITKSNIIFHGFRLLLAQGQIKPEDFRVVFLNESEELHISYFNEYGVCNYWPKNFFEEEAEISEKNIKISLSKRKKNYFL